MLKPGKYSLIEIITLSKDILDLLYVEGYEHMEGIVRKTKTLADICGEIEISAWLSLELSGAVDVQRVKSAEYDPDIFKKSFAVFKETRKVQDRKAKITLSRKMMKRLESNKPIDELQSEAAKIPYTSGVYFSLSELVERARKEPSLEGITTAFDIYWELIIGYNDYKGIINKIKSRINDYITEVYTEALQLRDSRKKRLFYRLKVKWEWLKSHKIILGIVLIVGFIASVATILMFFGFGFDDISSWCYGIFESKRAASSG